jgi:hypothetical protein
VATGIVAEVEAWVDREAERAEKLFQGGYDEVSAVVQEAKTDLENLIKKLEDEAKTTRATAAHDPQLDIRNAQARISARVRATHDDGPKLVGDLSQSEVVPPAEPTNTPPDFGPSEEEKAEAGANADIVESTPTSE